MAVVVLHKSEYSDRTSLLAKDHPKFELDWLFLPNGYLTLLLQVAEAISDPPSQLHSPKLPPDKPR